MYGGGFATIPAYLADLFGTQYVGAIHGRLLTAWSTAAIVGPVLITRIREFQIDRGIQAAAAYNTTLYILGGLLFVGFLANLLVRPVDKHHFMTEDELEEEWQVIRPKDDTPAETVSPTSSGMSWFAVAVAWTLVGVPLAWGILKTVEKASTLFTR